MARRIVRGLVGCGLLSVATFVGSACTVTAAPVASDGGLTGDSVAPAETSTPDAGGSVMGPLTFTPSNVDLSGIDLTKVGDFVVDGDCSVDTDTNLASCGDGAGVLGFKIATQSDGSKVAVYVAKSVTIQAGKSLSIAGSHPLVFIALETITIGGALNGNSREDVGVAGGSSQRTHGGKGVGPGGGAAAGALTASSGGSYCGIGGAGGAESGTPSPGGVAYGTPAITPLVAGSSGGDDSGGAGGGAIQLVAGTSITVESTGVIHVGAGRGGFGGISGQEGGGGGSGGSILLESLAVTVAGTLAANGGGAGAGTSSGVGSPPPQDPGGANATPNATPAAGGKAGVGPSSGGAGSAGASVDGVAGSFTPGNNDAAGGGGGGAGRIRINTKTAATLSGVLSPAATTPCVTQGTVH